MISKNITKKEEKHHRHLKENHPSKKEENKKGNFKT